MAQQLKMFALPPDHLILLTMSHMVEERELTFASCPAFHIHVHPYTYISLDNPNLRVDGVTLLLKAHTTFIEDPALMSAG